MAPILAETERESSMAGLNRSIRSHAAALLAVLLLAGIAGCRAAPPAAQTPVPATATATVPPQPTATRAPASPTTAPAPPSATPPPATPTAPPTAEPSATPPPAVESNNLFAAILGPVSAPDGWEVRPCEGDAPLLCVLAGQEVVGTVELTLYPIETLPDFQGMLDEAGVIPGPIDPGDPAQRAGLLEALRAFVANYHTIFESDRQVEYGDRVRYERLETEEIRAGALPGLRYGFAGLAADGSVYERWVSFVTFDGALLHIVVAHYRPDSFGTFRSDADLQAFLPHLTPIVAGLRLPLPVLDTEVRTVRALRDLGIFRAYGGDPGPPAGQVAAGESVPVTGLSPTRRYWRVACPTGLVGACWLPAGPDATDPAP